MITLGFLTTILFGISILLLISPKFNLLELIGFSYITGMGAQAILMLFINIIGLSLSGSLIMAFNLILSLLFLAFAFFRRKKKNEAFYDVSNLNVKKWFNDLSLVWFFCFAFIVFAVYLITLKSLFWPTFTHDSITSFNLYAKAIANEGSLFNSLIENKRVGYGVVYPPLYTFSLAYSFMLGASMSKIATALFFIGFPIAFYALTKKAVNATAAILFTTLVVFTPEILAQSAISITNVPQSIYASLGIMALWIWHKHKEERYFILSILMLGFSSFTRSEGIVYIGAAAAFLAYYVYQNKDYIRWIKFVGFSILPFFIWQIFLKANIDVFDHFTQASLSFSPFLDGARVAEIWTLTKFNLFHPQYYGLTIYVFLTFLVLNLYHIFVKKEGVGLLIMLGIGFFGYLFLIAHMDLRVDSIKNIMQYSAKRFFFGFIILMWFYIASSGTMKWLMEKVHPLVKFK